MVEAGSASSQIDGVVLAMSMDAGSSLWTSFLHPSFKDEYACYKEIVAVKAETLVADIANELLKNNADYTSETARDMAINVVIEQLLSTQFQHTPRAQRAMIANLFFEHPELEDIREDMRVRINSAIENAAVTQLRHLGFFQRLKLLFT